MSGKQKYIPRQRDYIEEVMTDRLIATRLGDTCTAEASGPQLVAISGPNGEPSMGVGWQLTLYLAHNKLIGKDPIFVSVPIGGIMLTEAVIKSITDRLLEEARKVRAKAENPAQAASAEEMLHAFRSGNLNGNEPAA